MHKSIMLTLCLGALLGVSATMHGADSNRARQKNAFKPLPLKFVASCKTHDDTFLIVKSDGSHPHVALGFSDEKFQKVHDIQGSILQIWEPGHECLVIEACLEMVKGVLLLKEEKHLVTEGKYLLLFGSKDTIEQGILDDKKWTLEDLLAKNPAIPAHAWLEIVHAVTWNHILQGKNRVGVCTNNSV